MTAITQSFPKVFGVMFNQTERWDVSFFRQISWHWSKDEIVPLGQVLRRKKVQVNKINIIEVPIIEKISFGGVVSITDIEERKNYKGKLFWANSRDLIYSKIRVKQGSLAIIPEDITSVAVSAEYPVYSVSDKINTIYLELVLRSKPFLALLDGLAHGGSTKTRIPPEEFERLEIPLPSIAIQEKIVNAWRQAESTIAKAKEKVSQIEQDTEVLILNSLGVSFPTKPKTQKVFPVFWKDLERWDLFFLRTDFAELENQLQNLHALPLGEILNFESRSWKKSDFPEGKFEYIEISSVNRENGIFSSRTVETNNAPSRATTLVKTGDLIISTTRPYLGAIAIVPEKYNNYVCSSGFALATSTKLPNVDIRYVLFFLTSKAGLLQLERRMTGGLYPAIIQEELEKIKIPVPSNEIQKEIMRRVEEGRSKIQKEQEAAAKVAEESESEVGRMILGLLKA